MTEAAMPRATPATPRATGTLAFLVALKVAIHLPAITKYGWFRDEFYYLSCAKRLAWGYVDQPPLSIALLALVRHTLGDSLVAVRILPLLAGAAAVWLAGELASAMGGGRTAQALAATATLAAPIYLALDHYYSMNALDLVFWELAALAFIRAVAGRTRDWAWLGVVLGLGLLNKLSMIWCAGGLAAGLLLTPHRRWLARPGPWIAAGIGAAIFLPHVFWQVRNHWPTLEFMHNATAHKMAATSITGFLMGQVLALNPLSAPLWIAGLWASLAGGQRAWRAFGIQYAFVMVLLLAMGKARVEYLSPAYPAIFALGALALERASAAPSRRWLRVPAFALPIAGLLLCAPLALPVLPVPDFIRYQSALGRQPHTEERHRMGALPQHFADMFGWPELARGAEHAAARLTPGERSRAVVIVDNYGEAGAIERLARDVPPVICPHNSWWMWGTHGWDGGVAIVLAGDSADVARSFRSVEFVEATGHPLAMPYEQGMKFFIARGLTVPLAKAWAAAKNYN